MSAAAPHLEDVRAAADELFERIVALRRDIHMHPETGFDVERTANLVREQLEAAGVSARCGVGRTGVVGDIEVAGASRRIALRADMDALPMREIATHEYRSRIPGKAHMCGHDAHTAMLLGAARILAGMRDRLRVNVRFIFQPCEEQLPGGAPAMIRDGVLDGVDEIFGLHVWPTLDAGFVGFCPGAAMAQPDTFAITVRGVGGHAAYPQTTVDPVLVASHAVLALHSIVSRNVDPLESSVLSVTQFNAGSADNVIAHEATLGGTVRTYSPRVQAAIEQRMREVLAGVTAAFNASYEMKYEIGYPVTRNHEAPLAFARGVAGELVGPNRVVFPAERVLGGEDFGYYVGEIPGCFIYLGSRNEEKGCAHFCHDPRFDIDEECLRTGVALHASLALAAKERL